MSSTLVPDTDHIARYCAPRTAPNGEIQATAFMLRADEQELSVNWLEYLRCVDRAAEIRQLQSVFAAKLKRVSAMARFAVLNVGQTRATVAQDSSDGRKLTVTHEPEMNDPSHSLIDGLRHSDEEIAEMLVELIRESHPAKV